MSNATDRPASQSRPAAQAPSSKCVGNFPAELLVPRHIFGINSPPGGNDDAQTTVLATSSTSSLTVPSVERDQARPIESIVAILVTGPKHFIAKNIVQRIPVSSSA